MCLVDKMVGRLSRQGPAITVFLIRILSMAVGVNLCFSTVLRSQRHFFFFFFLPSPFSNGCIHNLTSGTAVIYSFTGGCILDGLQEASASANHLHQMETKGNRVGSRKSDKEFPGSHRFSDLKINKEC